MNETLTNTHRGNTMTLTINFTNLNTNKEEILTVKASNKYVMTEKVQHIFPYAHIESWYAETSEWNAGNKGLNAEPHLHSFLAN